MKTKIPRVLLVDDHPIVLKGITTALEESKAAEVIGTALDAAESIRKSRELLPDIVLLDISLPDRSGLEVLRILGEQMPGSKVLIYTMHNNKEYIRESMALGAKGYILKISPQEVIAEAIMKVQLGETVLDRAILDSASGYGFSFQSVTVQEQGNSTSNALEVIRNCRLTKKEMQILQMIASGHTMQQIADALYVSYYTINTHFKNIYRKLEVHNRSSAVAKALKDQLIFL